MTEFCLCFCVKPLLVTVALRAEFPPFNPCVSDGVSSDLWPLPVSSDLSFLPLALLLQRFSASSCWCCCFRPLVLSPVVLTQRLRPSASHRSGSRQGEKPLLILHGSLGTPPPSVSNSSLCLLTEGSRGLLWGFQWGQRHRFTSSLQHHHPLFSIILLSPSSSSSL